MAFAITDIQRRYHGVTGAGATLYAAAKHDPDLLEHYYLKLHEQASKQDREFKAWAQQHGHAITDELRKGWVNQQAKAQFEQTLHDKLNPRELCTLLGIPYPPRVVEFCDPASQTWHYATDVVGACHKCGFPLLKDLGGTCPNCGVRLASDKCLHCGKPLQAPQLEFCNRHLGEHCLL